MQRRGFWVALLAAAALGAAGGLALSALVLGTARHGPAGPPGRPGIAGAPGPIGPPGRRGASGPPVNNAAVVKAISRNPARVARAIRPHLTPDPATICRDLKAAKALAHTTLPCKPARP